jgi:CDP-diacylglycerol---serine O-phosphatidyltransferase
VPQSLSESLRKGVPQALTAGRLLLGLWALTAALDGRLFVAATLITLGAVLDGLDGVAARLLRVATPFGAQFDYFADYVCFVIAPWALARTLLAAGESSLHDVVLALPVLMAAIRYARNVFLLGSGDLPGLGTVFFAFVCVAAVFADAETLLGRPNLLVILPGFIVIFSLLMVTPIRYPKIADFPGMSPAVLVLLALMPFVATKFLAGAMFLLGVCYAVFAPLFSDRSQIHARAHQVP